MTPSELDEIRKRVDAANRFAKFRDKKTPELAAIDWLAKYNMNNARTDVVRLLDECERLREIAESLSKSITDIELAWQESFRLRAALKEIAGYENTDDMTFDHAWRMVDIAKAALSSGEGK